MTVRPHYCVQENLLCSIARRERLHTLLNGETCTLNMWVSVLWVILVIRALSEGKVGVTNSGNTADRISLETLPNLNWPRQQRQTWWQTCTHVGPGGPGDATMRAREKRSCVKRWVSQCRSTSLSTTCFCSLCTQQMNERKRRAGPTHPTHYTHILVVLALWGHDMIKTNPDPNTDPNLN